MTTLSPRSHLTFGGRPDHPPLPSFETTQVARWLVQHAFSNPDGSPTLIHRRGSFFLHNGQRWYQPSGDTLRAMAYHHLADAYMVVHKARSTDHVRFAPTRSKIDDVLDALEAEVHINESVELPAFIPPAPGDTSDTSGLLVFPNVTIDCRESPTTIHPPTDGGTVMDLTPYSRRTTPRLVSLSGISVPYDPTAQCPRWVQALSEWGNDDPSWSLSLERMLAYALLPTRRYAKWFLLEGKSRAGKGTVLSILRQLLGPTAFFSTDFSQLSDRFGLDGIQNATVLAIPEVSTVNTLARDRISTVLKLCLGEDPMVINAKNIRQIRNVMPAAVPILASNEIPLLANKASGLSSKMVPIPFDVSFRGREDPALKDTLLTELPGIAARLAQHACALLHAGRQPFTLSARAQARLHHFHLTNNAAEAFLEARFVRNATGRVSYPLIRSAFEHWKNTNRVRMPHIPDNRFGTWLIENSTWDELRTGEWRTAPGSDEKSYGIYGLSLRPEANDLIKSA